MDALFVNRYLPTIKLFETFYKKTSQKYSRVVGIIGLALVAVAFMTLYSFGGINYLMGAVSLFGVLLCFALIFFHKIMAYSAMRRTMKAHDGKILQTTVTFSDKITMREGTDTVSVKYSELTDVIDCGSLIALMAGKANGIIVKKDGFITGDVKSFLDFIEKKVKK